PAGRLPPRPEPVSPALLRPRLLRGRADRPGGQRDPARRTSRPAAWWDRRVGRDGALGVVVGAVPVDRQRWPGLVLVRLGVAAAGSGLPRDLPRTGEHRPTSTSGVVAVLAAVPGRVRRRTDQNPWRPVLAGPHRVV